MEQVYSYLVPEAFLPHVQIGSAVLVPFGKRFVTGIVVGTQQLASSPDESARSLKPIHDLLDTVPVMNEALLKLTKWIAEYYVCSWGDVLKAALPTGIEQESKHKLYRGNRSVLAWSGSPIGWELIGFLDRHTGGVTKAQVQEGIGHHISSELVRQLELGGFIRVEVEIEGAKVRIKTEKHVRMNEIGRDLKAKIRAQLKGEKQISLLQTLEALIESGEAEPTLKSLLEKAQAPRSSLRALVEQGLIEVVEKEVLRTPFGDVADTTVRVPIHALHEAQNAALTLILKPIEAETYQSFLLHGVTGSGKTEVYIAALQAVLEKGKTGIVLVPEIGLTPQTVRRFRAHFGDQIAVIHSKMSLGERYDAWRSLRNGKYSIVIGPRSAIFAPLDNLGIVIVDEEHESSYKQYDPAPRYHARDVAVMRAVMQNAVCILGSATPALESYMNSEWGKYTLLRMPVRVPVAGHAAAPLPIVSVVDLTLEKKLGRLNGAFSKALIQAIEHRLEKKEQVILLQNRRGYAPVVECTDCGWSPHCNACAVTMTYHKSSHILQCHYCGSTQGMPYYCPKCRTGKLQTIGMGTQRVEEELQAIFPKARLVRMDLDTTTTKNAHRTLLDAFGNYETDILIGTQMIAKGLDFSRVTLVGVINADTGMLMPDFRATEQTFQLLTQVAGRSGRGDLRGEVILQTRNPLHPVIEFSRRHNYLGFMEAELPQRRDLHYPPFGRMVAVEFRGVSEQKTLEMATNWTNILKEITTDSEIDVLGPHAPMIGRIQREYRFHTLLRAPRKTSPVTIQNALRQTKTRFGTTPKHCRYSIDIDPVGIF